MFNGYTWRNDLEDWFKLNGCQKLTSKTGVFNFSLGERYDCIFSKIVFLVTILFNFLWNFWILFGLNSYSIQIYKEELLNVWRNRMTKSWWCFNSQVWWFTKGVTHDKKWKLVVKCYNALSHEFSWWQWELAVIISYDKISRFYSEKNQDNEGHRQFWSLKTGHD